MTEPTDESMRGWSRAVIEQPVVITTVELSSK